MADYWMKLYMEILDDPKMATLPDRLWRRTIELFLLAKRENKGGALPEAQQIAWVLRMETDDILMDLKQIAMTGIIKQTADGWLVTNFQKRQDPSTATERKRQQREREHKEQYYNTELSRNVTQSRLTDYRLTESDTEENVTGAFVDVSSLIIPMVCRVSNMSSIPPKEVARSEQLIGMVQTYGPQETEAALKRCCDRWRKTPRKNGTGYYSVTNMGWVDWAQDELVGNVPVEREDLDNLRGEELKAALLEMSEK